MPIMGKGAGRRDGTSATGGVVHRIVTMHVTAGIGAGPPHVQQKALSSGVGGTSSGAGRTASGGLWAGGGRGLTVGATGGINGAGGRAWDGAGVATAAGGTWGNRDGECDGDRAQSSGVVVGSWEASVEGDRAAVVATNEGGSRDIAEVGQGSDAGDDRAIMMGTGCGVGGTSVGDEADSAGSNSGDAGSGESALASTGSGPTGEGIGDGRTSLGGRLGAANIGCGGSAGSWQSDEAGDRRGAGAGTCGGQAWTRDRGAAAAVGTVGEGNAGG